MYDEIGNKFPVISADNNDDLLKCLKILEMNENYYTETGEHFLASNIFESLMPSIWEKDGDLTNGEAAALVAKAARFSIGAARVFYKHRKSIDEYQTNN
ncbi:MAG: hypothetical protein F6K54_27975 [Okeania sp. SIO3B5]|uniref:hypothetical protein n=1 Tax=Okeania sp. SIO3B5 TaxID=2607811 RepID=UPI0014011091|nr:hypothetical protein [Okeania sp. SIO3B5]NEO56576.1 hypothetical protein [Okeania sp. SIO3B5]